jgi:Subtilase family
MDSVFDAQFRNMRDAFLDRGVDIRIAYRPDGEVDYVYQAGRILTLQSDVRASIDNLSRVLPGIEPVPLVSAETGEAVTDRLLGRLRMWSIENLRDGQITVPEALDLVDRALLGDDEEDLSTGRPRPVATPVHVLHITPARSCPADEPSVPSGRPTDPWPVSRPAHPYERRVSIGVSDTGFLEGADTEHYWLGGVTGDRDDLGPVLPSGRHLIPEYTGHGTFIAGVIRSVCSDTDIFVARDFPASGAWLEHEVVASIENLVLTRSPDLISLSAGSYTRGNWEPLTFTAFHDRYDVTLIAAAGNESTDRPFYPAAFDWVIGVGALATDEVHRAWFSNYGPWVDVYAIGEGLVDAYATGTYEYQEPPRRPARQDFDGMARWDGTSFSTPVVTGLIAARLAENPGETPQQAAAAVLEQAATQALRGVGPALFP